MTTGTDALSAVLAATVTDPEGVGLLVVTEASDREAIDPVATAVSVGGLVIVLLMGVVTVL